ncbi:hypothetical protein [Halodesulfovibrio sp.]|uniref:hypothetical protein n=1 Tax=Halodesulfovibrio sp. TaxID=1912772 RepID=UPI0025CB7E58|nr:hypothetical protein [Halodesulfovibrio sp.]MCT4535107.1 hypothetical protein [Halodesulfovibrio sp.]
MWIVDSSLPTVGSNDESKYPIGIVFYLCIVQARRNDLEDIFVAFAVWHGGCICLMAGFKINNPTYKI